MGIDPITLAAAATVGGSILKGNSDKGIADASAAASRYGVDKQFENSALDRAFQEKLQALQNAQGDKTLGSQQAFAGAESEKARQQAINELLKSQEFTGKESQKARDLSQQQLSETQSFQGSESEKARQAAIDELIKSQTFSGSEANKNRALSQEQLGQTQQFGASESQKSRDQAIQELLQSQQFSGSESAKNRDLSQSQLSSTQNFADSQAQKGRDFEASQLGGVLDRSNQQLQSGESELFSSLNAPNPELEAMKASYIANALPGQERARNEMALNIRQQGARGGQAATLLDRGTGAFNQGLESDLNNLTYQDALARRNAKTDYLANKAKTAQTRNLSGVGV